ncbi:MAG: polyphosphate polymerase domain-containing protein [Acetatifactor sp.]|nr:polyphosphate polymerase domain-containing protein [Acetatifactor sp.]
MASPMVFERYEIKYFLTREQKDAVLSAMAPHMEPDSFGRSTIRNLYYDTDNYRLVRRSLERPLYKEKLRVRSYCTAKPEDEVFIELKKKYNSIVYKRRTGIREKEAADYLAGRLPAPKRCQITDEIDYFRQFYGTLAPRVFLSYEREAFFEKGDGSFRVTFDENILWRTTDLSLEAGIYGENILKPGQILMELKTAGSIPLWMVDILTGQKLQRTSFSKYGSAYTTMLIREKEEEEVYA